MKYLGTFKVMGNGVMGDGFTFTSKRTAIKTMRKIAMGNANKNIKALADVIVNDCDNGGCSQAIYNYLLAEKELAL